MTLSAPDLGAKMLTYRYSSPLGGILLASDGEHVTGLWFENARFFARGLSREHSERPTPVFADAGRWLDDYFAGRRPENLPPLAPCGTPFQLSVWERLLEIPYGETTTYGEIASWLGREKMSAQAVGGAVGRNPVSIMIPCHRVVGKSGSLTGYAGGMERKIYLLRLEGADTRRFFAP